MLRVTRLQQPIEVGCRKAILQFDNWAIQQLHNSPIIAPLNARVVIPKFRDGIHVLTTPVVCQDADRSVSIRLRLQLAKKPKKNPLNAVINPFYCFLLKWFIIPIFCIHKISINIILGEQTKLPEDLKGTIVEVKRLPNPLFHGPCFGILQNLPKLRQCC